MSNETMYMTEKQSKLLARNNRIVSDYKEMKGTPTGKYQEISARENICVSSVQQIVVKALGRQRRRAKKR